MLDDFINEKNLNLLNRELLEMNKEYLLTNDSNVEKELLPKDIKRFSPENEEIDYMKNKVEELSQVIIDKMSFINDQNDQIVGLKQTVEKQSNKIKFLKKTLHSYEEIKTENLQLTNKLREKDSEIRQKADKISKLNEKIKEQDVLLTEFQNLVNTCNAKFQKVEDKCKEFTDEIEQQKKKLTEKESIIEKYEQTREEVLLARIELQKKKEEFSNSVAVHSAERRIWEENLKSKYHCLEQELRTSILLKEDQIKEEYLKQITHLEEGLKTKSDQLETRNKENDLLNEKLNDFSHIIKLKEREFIETIQKKECEKEKLSEIINEVNNQLNTLEERFHAKMNEYQHTFNLANNEIQEKNRELIVYAEENDKMRLYVNELEQNYNLLSCRHKEVSNSYNQLLKNQKLLEKELNSRNEDLERSELMKNNHLDAMNSRLEIIKSEENQLLNDNLELKRTLQLANIRIRELLEENSKVKTYEENLKYVVSENKRLERTICDLSAKHKQTSEKGEYESMRYNKFLNLKDEEVDNLRQAYESKIEVQRTKNQELKEINDNLVKEIASLKDMIKNLENNNMSNINENYLKSDYTVLLSEKDYNRNLENLRDIITKVDNNMTTSYLKKY